MLEQLPSFYDFLGYMYYCGGTIAGPFFEFKDYINFIGRTGHYKDIPNTIVPSLTRFSHAVCKKYHQTFMNIVFIIINALFGDMFTPEFLITDEFASHNIIYKVILIR